MKSFSKIAIYLFLMSVMALPLLSPDYRVPKLLPSIWLLLIHEFSGFAFVGHTIFSNIWSMRVRQTQSRETGIWARAMIRKMALSITLPTTIITPLAGLMLIEDWGGLHNAWWAWDAYLCFWIMAGLSLWPDLIRLFIDEHAAEPTHGMRGGGIRGVAVLPLVIYIIVCMVTKQAWIAPFVFT
ncbi:MAG: hypothetical protein KJP03_01800 [Gammaproteobacteria bacterium]|nr:hypothetical protein [Gammaproteobacteria bacterium]